MTQPNQNIPSLNLFYSYAHVDEDWCNKVIGALGTLRRQGYLAEWYDRKISPGTNWELDIDTRLEQAQIILLLISQSFINSDYCYGREMNHALARHAAGTARVIPIFVRPADTTNMSFMTLQGLPVGAKPISTWLDEDEALLNIAGGIRRVVEELRQSMQSGHEIDVMGQSNTTQPAKWNIPCTATTLSIQECLSIVQSYIDRMSELIRKDNLRESKSDNVVRNIARMQTLTSLRRLDAAHKEQVLRFLSEAGLISVINLDEADFKWSSLE